MKTQKADVATVAYHGKHFTVPDHDSAGFEIVPDAKHLPQGLVVPAESPVIKDLNTVWDIKKFLVPRKPVSICKLGEAQLKEFSTPGALRTLDMPIKFPGSPFRIPNSLKQFRHVIETVAAYEALVNKACYDEYYCYMTVDQGYVEPDTLQREAPCHVDGFQGARWNPKTKINHTYTIGDCVPTTYYVQPFELRHLDETKHNFFWEMNNIVAKTKSAHAYQPAAGELTLMDAYCVHRGTEAPARTFRTWLRLSFEVRIFDRPGNAHNPLFQYDWPMLKRDIEGLNLEPYDKDSDASLRVFPWQDTEGNPNPGRRKTKPKLK